MMPVLPGAAMAPVLHRAAVTPVLDGAAVAAAPSRCASLMTGCRRLAAASSGGRAVNTAVGTAGRDACSAEHTQRGQERDGSEAHDAAHPAATRTRQAPQDPIAQ
jgi:hypothetical protein